MRSDGVVEPAKRDNRDDTWRVGAVGNRLPDRSRSDQVLLIGCSRQQEKAGEVGLELLQGRLDLAGL